METSLTLEVGALADPPSAQLAGLVKNKQTLALLDLMMHSINVCFVQGLLSPLETDRARIRFMKKVKAAIEKEAAS